MRKQNIFRTGYIDILIKEATKPDGWKRYTQKSFEIDENETIPNISIRKSPPKLKIPEKSNNYDFENSKILYEAYKELSPVQATDTRLWVYLAHGPYWEYMQVRRPVEKQPIKKRGDYILTHWFIKSVSATYLLRQDISLLWWTAHLTYDEKLSDPYKLTKEAFSMLDYTRFLLPGTQGRSPKFTHALIEYVIENQKLFSKNKQDRVRLLMRKSNYMAGYKIFPSLSKKEIKSIFDDYKSDIESIKH